MAIRSKTLLDTISWATVCKHRPSKYLHVLNRRINCWLDAIEKADTQQNSETGNLTSGWAYGIHHPSRQALGCGEGLALAAGLPTSHRELFTRRLNHLSVRSSGSCEQGGGRANEPE